MTSRANDLIRVLSVFLMTTIVSLFMSCSKDYLDKLPETEIGAENFFKTEEDLSIYLYSLYNFPDINLYYEDEATDNAATTGNREIKTIMTAGANSANLTSGWNWNYLRDINFFLEHAQDADIP